MLKHVVALLRPVASLCLKSGVLLQEIVEGLKQALVEESLRELRSKGLKETVSLISLMSGIHRRDVTRLVNSELQTNLGGPLAAQVIGLWRSSPDYANKLGKPRVLSVDGPESEFAHLVRAVNKELNPATVLKELERVNAVKRTPIGIKFTESAYITRKDDGVAVGLLAYHMQSLVESVSENLRSPGAKKNINLHLGTEFDAIPDACLEEVKLWLPREGTRFHERIQDYLAQYDADTNRNLQELPGRNRVSLVSFSYAKPTAASQSDEPDKPASQKSPRRLRR